MFEKKISKITEERSDPMEKEEKRKKSEILIEEALKHRGYIFPE